ncbi:competence type IV pilus major pilin ComGC [Priestia koreensis]|uniref:competence type IV pilus major pilin ComGC n=1 Tax=Priestia koreensis TaxID=284581 RepID=UPI0024128278|nr:competence type IV pilus major pilin ComGC [Priestia koreensis]
MKEKGFTLIEMLVVMLVVTVLLLVIIPNVVKNKEVINTKGCSALIKTVQSQVEAYEIDNRKIPTLEELKTEGYLKGDVKCPGGQEIAIVDGVVQQSGSK